MTTTLKLINKLKDAKAIFFDFGGTLYEISDPIVDIWEKVLKTEGIEFDKAGFFNALKIARNFLDNFTAKKVYLNQNPKMSYRYWVSYHALILKNMGVNKYLLKSLSFKITQLIYDVEKKYKINKDTKKILATLKQKYKIGLISNTSVDLRTYLNQDGIYQHFNVIGLSYEMALWKPDKRIFEQCCKEAGYIPQNCIYVGDSLICDLKGSMKAGMIPMLICNHTKAQKIKEGNFIQIESINNILRILELSNKTKDQ